MFSKLLENPDLPFQDQKEVIKSVITTNLKQNVHEVRLQFNHNYNKLKPILLKHWKYSLRIALSLHTWQVCRELLQGKQQNQATDLLYSLASQNNTTQKTRYLLVDLAKTYHDNSWKSLAVLTVISDSFASSISSKDFGWFLAAFVKVSAVAIEGYLKIKHEPIKSNEDRIQNDSVLVKYSEQWLTKAYIKLITSLATPLPADKHAVLASFSQICGALLQNQRAGNLQPQKLREILKVAGEFIIKHYDLKEIGNTYLKVLRESNYSYRLRKIQIPQLYTNKSEMANEGICWLLLLFAKEGKGIYSDSVRLQWLLVAFSESLQSALPLKEEALKAVKNILSTNNNFNLLQIDYPLGLLLFNIHHSYKEEFAFFKEKLGFGLDQKTDINRWKRLLSIDLGNLNVQKTALVISNITEIQFKEKDILLLAKSLKFQFTTQDLSKSVQTFLTSVAASHGASGKKALLALIRTEESKNRNKPFCEQLKKALAL